MVHLPAASIGSSAVALFFVLSGFVLAWSAKPGAQARAFYVRRVARIYPVHLVMLAAAAVLPVVQVARSVTVALPSLFLVQAWSTNLNVVYGMNGDS
ncbi:MAG TPA: acyltransferase family protein [Acidimicrobiales bacterium]|nr:acyltransferase family protein [Acidimicrobiales bacterium]